MSIKTKILGLFVLIGSFNTLQCQKDFRKGIRGFLYSKAEGSESIKVTKIVPNSALEKAGLKVDDIITAINDRTFNTYEDRYSMLGQLPADEPLTFNVVRNGKSKKIRAKLDPIPKEVHSNTNVEYGILNHKGDLLSTIVTTPKEKRKKKYPAVFLVQWLSCDAIEISGNPADGMEDVIKSFANNPDIIFYRVERSGVGHSKGTACGDLDAKREIETYKKALAELKKRPDVDQSKIFILGLSLGTSIAPVIGEGQNISGYMVSGGATKTWYEHMLEFERNRLELSGNSPDKVNTSMRDFSDFYLQYLVKKKTPEQIISTNPSYKELWYDDPRHQWGRNVKYYQQIQDLNFEEAWSQVKVPMLVLYGEYDWVMSLRDHQMIKDITGNDTELIVLPKTGHLLNTYPTLKDAFEDKIGKINPEAYSTMKQWLENRLETN